MGSRAPALVLSMRLCVVTCVAAEGGSVKPVGHIGLPLGEQAGMERDHGTSEPLHVCLLLACAFA